MIARQAVCPFQGLCTKRGIYTDKITSEALDKIIAGSVIEIEITELDGEILFPGLFKYWFDEDGHPHKCND